MTRHFELLSRLETPVILDGEQICFLRTVKVIPYCFTETEWHHICEIHYIHELGQYGYNKTAEPENLTFDKLAENKIKNVFDESDPQVYYIPKQESLPYILIGGMGGAFYVIDVVPASKQNERNKI